LLQKKNKKKILKKNQKGGDEINRCSD